METETSLDIDQEKPRSGHISDVGMLDLTSARTPEDLVYIASLSNIGAILVPENLSAALSRVPMQNIGAIVPIATGDNVDMITGQTKLTGESLAAGDPETVLVIVGQVIVTTRVEKVGYKGLQIVGQMIATRGSETALASKVKRLSGQLLYCAEGARIFMGSETVTQEFLEMLPAPTPFLVMGQLRFDRDITADVLREKVSEIVLMGQIIVGPEIATLVQFLTVEKMGDIAVQE
jgi:hypothetical protein